MLFPALVQSREGHEPVTFPVTPSTYRGVMSILEDQPVIRQGSPLPPGCTRPGLARMLLVGVRSTVRQRLAGAVEARVHTNPWAVELRQLRRAIERSWTRSTSSDPEHWSEKNPAHGQCAVTALVVQDCLGGELLRARVKGVMH